MKATKSLIGFHHGARSTSSDIGDFLGGHESNERIDTDFLIAYSRLDSEIEPFLRDDNILWNTQPL